MQPDAAFRPETTENILRRRPLRRLAELLRDRCFTYDRYDRWLARLNEAGARVVPLRELAGGESPTEVTIGLRHDVDDRLDSALRIAELEHERGVRATYFVLHTARYYGSLTAGRAAHDESLIAPLLRLQGLGHEVGWHNDLVTLQLVYGLDPVEYVLQELEWLRRNGIRVVGTAAHGSVHCHRLGYHNNEFFLDWAEPIPGAAPSRTHLVAEGRPHELGRARLSDLGLDYEAYHLDVTGYWSDSTFDDRGRRWHPDLLEPSSLQPGDRAVVLVHPCHWDASFAAKATRVGSRLVRRTFTR